MQITHWTYAQFTLYFNYINLELNIMTILQFSFQQLLD